MVRSSSASAACERAAAAWRSSGRIWRRTSRTRSPRRSRFSWVAASRRSARSRRRRCLSTPAASSMIARRSSGRAFSTVSSWPWPMIMCCWRPTPESLSSSWMSSSRHGGAVDGVLAVAGTEERPGDRHLGHVDRELARRVVDGQRHLGPAERRPAGRPGEDDVLHLRRAQRPRALGAEHPGHGVDDVGLAAAVGADDDGDPRLELEHRGVGERLEPLHAERLQEHRSRPYWIRSAATLAPRQGSDSCPDQTWQCSQKKVERPPTCTADDRVAAAAAGLALAVVDLVAALVVADLAEEVPVLLVGRGSSPGA